MPRVSIIVPNYNHEKYLPQRLESIFGQTFGDFELILLDDASTDGSRDLLESYRDNPKVAAVILGESNGGSAFRQWKKGFDAASGELVWIAESDDFCSPLLLETLVKEFDRDPECVLAFCASMLTSEDGTPRSIHHYQQEIGRDLHINGKEFARKWLIRNNYVVNASGALLRKSALSSLGERWCSYSGAGDWLFWTGLSLQGNVAFVFDALNFFRQHSTNTTAAMMRSGKALLELRSLLSDFEKLGLYDRRIWLMHRVFAIHSAKWRQQLPPALKAQVLRIWEDNPAISFLAFLKEMKRRALK